MSDVHNPSVRSKNMRAIKHKDTKPEVFIRNALHARGLRFRLHVNALHGNPDIVLPKYKVAIFINGCFWHGHHCHLSITPKNSIIVILDDDESIRGAWEPVGLKIDGLQNHLSGPYFTGFFVNISILTKNPAKSVLAQLIFRSNDLSPTGS
jgi:DNA mismatch endonuclease Vsr